MRCIVKEIKKEESKMNSLITDNKGHKRNMGLHSFQESEENKRIRESVQRYEERKKGIREQPRIISDALIGEKYEIIDPETGRLCRVTVIDVMPNSNDLTSNIYLLQFDHDESKTEKSVWVNLNSLEKNPLPEQSVVDEDVEEDNGEVVNRRRALEDLERWRDMFPIKRNQSLDRARQYLQVVVAGEIEQRRARNEFRDAAYFIQHGSINGMSFEEAEKIAVSTFTKK